MLGVAGVLLGLSLKDALDGEGNPGLAQTGQSDATTATGFVLEDDVARLRRHPLPDAESPSEPTPEPTPSAVTRLVVPKIGIDAPVVTLTVDGNGLMQSPSGPEEVGWYDFTGNPGLGGNAVFSGHVDYRNYGPAVFWELRNLTPGDVVEVRLEDGSAYTYVVVKANSYPANDAPIEEIVGPTPRESVTLITCAGSFDYNVRQYSHRLVVRAERLSS